MLPTDDPEKLHLIAEFRNAIWSLRLLGFAIVASGVVVAGIGISHTLIGGPYSFVIVIGAMLVACGLWSLIVRGAIGVITHGLVGVLVGLLYILDAFVGGTGPSLWAWGICVFMGTAALVGCFSEYVRYSKIFRSGVTSDEMATLVAFARDISNGDGEHDDHIIDFEMIGIDGRYRGWRGQLMPRMAVFVNQLTRRLIVARKDDVTIDPQSKALFGSSWQAAITIRDHRWQGKISPKSFERYRDWKWVDAEDEIRRKFAPDEREIVEGVQRQLVSEPPVGNTI